MVGALEQLKAFYESMNTSCLCMELLSYFMILMYMLVFNSKTSNKNLYY